MNNRGSPDSKLIALEGTYMLESDQSSHQIKVWDIDSQRLVTQVKTDNWGLITYPYSPGTRQEVVVAGEKKVMEAVSSNGEIAVQRKQSLVVWNLAEGKELGDIEAPQDAQIVLSSNGRFLLLQFPSDPSRYSGCGHAQKHRLLRLPQAARQSSDRIGSHHCHERPDHERRSAPGTGSRRQPVSAQTVQHR